MGVRFELFRLSLLVNPQSDLLKKSAELPTREEYLREIFLSTQRYAGRKNPYVYVPAPVKFQKDNVIIGRIGRTVKSSEHLPPEEGMEETVRDTWQGSIIVLDPTQHSDGQKIAVEVDIRVGKPPMLLTNILDYFNNLKQNSPPYLIQFKPIFNDRTFWEFAERYKGRITSISFDFIPPNMVGLSGSGGSIADDLRTYRREANATRVGLQLKSKTSINTDSQLVRDAVDFSSGGAADFVAKTKDGAVYQSRSQNVTSRLEIDGEFEGQGTKNPNKSEMIAQTASNANQVLDRR